MQMSLSEIARNVDGQLIGEDLTISAVSINTRTLVAGDLFVAIKGQNFDAHRFVMKAYDFGAAAVIVDHEVDLEIPQVIVNDTQLALAQLASAWKQKADVKTIAVTGSNGKTTVKEMIAAILVCNAEVMSTKGNLNNEIGVPLTLLTLQETHQFAVVEMGANHAGEIAYSSQFTKPDVAVITNVGDAHIEGFGSLAGTAKAKAEIIQGLTKDGVAVLNKDDDFYSMWRDIAAGKKIVSFGVDKDADIKAKNVISSVDEQKHFVTRFTLSTANDEIDVSLKLAGKHNVSNALAAAASCLSVNITLPQIKKGLESLFPVIGRLQPLVGQQGSLIIDDTYNANPSSVKSALDVLLQCEGEPWVVFGALGEMGLDSIKKHKEMGELIKSMNVVRLLTFGSDAESTSNAFGKGATFFDSQQQLIDVLKQELTGCEAILIKGSRAQKMENIAAALVADFRK